MLIVEMGKTARLGLKVDHASTARSACSRRNGEDSPVGIESCLPYTGNRRTLYVEMGKTARLGLKEAEALAPNVSLFVEMGKTARLGLKVINHIILTWQTAVEMGKTARLGLKELKTWDKAELTLSKWGRQPGWD